MIQFRRVTFSGEPRPNTSMLRRVYTVKGKGILYVYYTYYMRLFIFMSGIFLDEC